jgi:hypothetical protein
MLGIGVPDGGSRAQRTRTVTETGDLIGQLLGGFVQFGVRGQGAQLVGDREQRREVTGQPDVQLLCPCTVREFGLGHGVYRLCADRFVHGGPPS